jgi:hypothetical protein
MWTGLSLFFRLGAEPEPFAGSSVEFGGDVGEPSAAVERQVGAFGKFWRTFR